MSVAVGARRLGFGVAIAAWIAAALLHPRAMPFAELAAGGGTDGVLDSIGTLAALLGLVASLVGIGTAVALMAGRVTIPRVARGLRVMSALGAVSTAWLAVQAWSAADASLGRAEDSLARYYGLSVAAAVLIVVAGELLDVAIVARRRTN